MFDANSRYAKAKTWQVVDRRGRTVTVVEPAPGSEASLLGYHVLKEGQRLDHLAGRYLSDPTQWWRLCDLADAMLPDALLTTDELPIPRRP
ncbi:MAG: hypothetical protein AAF449_10050 [Myxococcota bacterium]